MSRLVKLYFVEHYNRILHHIKYLALKYPLRASDVEDKYWDYVEETGKIGLIGFEINYLKPLQFKDEEQIKYLALRYPIRCSRIEELYHDYVEKTGREDFVGFELTSLREEYDIVARGIYLQPIYNSVTGEPL